MVKLFNYNLRPHSGYTWLNRLLNNTGSVVDCHAQSANFSVNELRDISLSSCSVTHPLILFKFFFWCNKFQLSALWGNAFYIPKCNAVHLSDIYGRHFFFQRLRLFISPSSFGCISLLASNLSSNAFQLSSLGDAVPLPVLPVLHFSFQHFSAVQCNNALDSFQIFF